MLELGLQNKRLTGIFVVRSSFYRKAISLAGVAQ